MKNTSKKSKFVILPALATLVLTSVATVTGTAAWFTASRDTTISGKFVSVKTDSKLNVELTAGIGTDIDGTKKSVSVQGNMTHGSYNANAKQDGKLYVASLNDVNQITAYLDKKSLADNRKTEAGITAYPWLAKYGNGNSENNIWYAVSWTMNFTYGASADGETNYLLFSPKDSTIGNEVKNDQVTLGDTYKGFRIALMSGTKYLVVGGDSEAKHVTGTTAGSVAPFDKYEDLNGADKPEKLTDNHSDLTKNDYKYSFGTIDNTSGVSITCVAWFEGEDSNIVNEISVNGENQAVVMSNVIANLNFYTRSINAEK